MNHLMVWKTLVSILIELISNDNFEDHLNKFKIVSKKLKAAGIKINAEKSFFAKDNLNIT